MTGPRQGEKAQSVMHDSAGSEAPLEAVRMPTTEHLILLRPLSFAGPFPTDSRKISDLMLTVVKGAKVVAVVA